MNTLNRSSVMNLVGIFMAALIPTISNATIIYTGGSLTGVTPTMIAGGQTSFDATQSQLITTFNPFTHTLDTASTQTAHVSGTLEASDFSLSGQATTQYDYQSRPYTGFARGSINFTVTSAIDALFSWQQNVGAAQAGLSMSIMSIDGVTLLGCVGDATFFTPIAGGCAIGSMPNQRNHGLLDVTGPLSFAPGQYILDFNFGSSYLVGRPDDVGFRFDLTAIPIAEPAIAPLLLGGLFLVGGFARNQRVRLSQTPFGSTTQYRREAQPARSIERQAVFR